MILNPLQQHHSIAQPSPTKMAFNFKLIALRIKRFLLGKTKKHYQKTYLTGEQAEVITQSLIDNYCIANPSARAVHNSFLVFNEDTPQEFSIEIDHILITDKNLFVIETKSQKGIITAPRKAKSWQVMEFNGSRFIRNASLQVQNQAKVLRRELNLSTQVVPLVVFVGDVQLKKHDFHHVCTNDSFVALLDSHEQFRYNTLSPATILEMITNIRSFSQVHWQRHIERAQLAKNRLPV